MAAGVRLDGCRRPVGLDAWMGRPSRCPGRGYVVRDKDLLYKTGVLWRSVQAFPFNRVQHTKLASTPLDRRFGLASLAVFPAGAVAGQRIRGLGRETAERLRVYVSKRIEAEAAAAASALAEAEREFDAWPDETEPERPEAAEPEPGAPADSTR